LHKVEAAMSRVLTVRSALELEVFQRTEVRVLAGAQHLDRPVRWVHTGEIPDIHRFLTGGEMLLTAGLGMGSTAEEQRGFIRRIAEARAAVLVVELAGRMFTTMPAAAIETAEELGLPLVGLSEEVPFVEASAQVHEMLVEMRIAELVAEEATGQAFMDLLLAGEDYLGLTAELARRTGRPVVLENVNHHILAYSGATADADRITGQWGVHSRTMHERHTTPADPVRRVPTARAGSFREVAACARRPVVLRGESWGWLHLMHGEVTPSRADLNALDRASAAVAITLLSEREHGARAAKREGALINRLLLEDISGEDFIGRALGIGHDLRERSLVIGVAGRNGDAGSATETLAALLHEAGLPAVVGDIGDFDLAVIGLPDRTTDRDLVALLEDGGIWGGLSRPAEPAGLVTAIRQGRSAATAAAVTGRPASGPGTVLRFDDLGVLRLLVAVAEGPELAQYVEDELGELLHHDASSANPLLPTLRAFLDQGANKSRAADVLFVQRRTLYYRLERIGAILGLDLEDLDVRQRLQLALRGHDLLRRPLSGR
jgi:purine catabolism regulator